MKDSNLSPKRPATYHEEVNASAFDWLAAKL